MLSCLNRLRIHMKLFPFPACFIYMYRKNIYLFLLLLFLCMHLFWGLLGYLVVCLKDEMYNIYSSSAYKNLTKTWTYLYL